MTPTPHWTDILTSISACPDGLAWAKTHDSFASAWAACERGDWMLWYAGRLCGEPGSDSRRPLTLAACECARLALPVWQNRFPNDLRVETAISTAERWAQRVKGVTLDGVRAARKHASAYAAAAATTATYSAYAYAAAAAAADAAYAAAAAATTTATYSAYAAAD
ncbi:MAG: hypothetical protein QG602_2128, partial [Verrucomicrobiota bacterium]|nr:hypothetical protein [Verrucomicrobiota bacterium]